MARTILAAFAVALLGTACAMPVAQKRAAQQQQPVPPSNQKETGPTSGSRSK
jgi:hypothetical protein